MKMFEKILQLFAIRCRHRRTTQPFAAAASSPRAHASASWEPVGNSGRHYVVCLDCGTKFDYDWQTMRIVS
jgi:hypothetical protein